VLLGPTVCQGKWFKGLAVYRVETTILPGGVREYKLEDLAFFRHGLLLVQCDGLLHEFEQFYPSIQIRLIGVLMVFNVL
jgi:hypothetical protein